MTKEKEAIINEFLKDFKYDVHFENKQFIYWIEDEYHYNGDAFTREEFKEIIQNFNYFNILETHKKTLIPESYFEE